MYLTILCHRLQAYKGSVTQKKVSDPSLTDPFPQLKYLQLLSGTRFLLCVAARPCPVV